MIIVIIIIIIIIVVVVVVVIIIIVIIIFIIIKLPLLSVLRTLLHRVHPQLLMFYLIRDPKLKMKAREAKEVHHLRRILVRR